MITKDFDQAAKELGRAMRGYNLSNTHVPHANVDFWDNYDEKDFGTNCYSFANNVAPFKFHPDYAPKFMVHPGEIACWTSVRKKFGDLSNYSDIVSEFSKAVDANIEADFPQFVNFISEKLITDGLTPLDYNFSIANEGSTVALFCHDRDKPNEYLDPEHDFHFAAVRIYNNKLTWCHKPMNVDVQLSSPKGIFNFADFFGYDHFAGYFHCPNDLGFPSLR